MTPAFLSMTLSAWRLNFAPRRMGSSVTSFAGIFTMPSASRSFLPGSPNFSVNTSYGVLSSRTPHVIRYKDVLKWLKIHSRTLDYYIQRGYLKRVYGGGERAIGVSRDSYLKFIARRSGR